MFQNTLRYSLGVLTSATHLTVALFDRVAGEWVYWAHQPRELAQAVLREVQSIFGAVQAFEATL